MGAQLRASQQREASRPAETDEPSAARARPRSHLRRAHWHTYWTGTGRRTPRVRWVLPALVGQGEVVPTIHPVE